jgi:hypothetical protein
VHNALRWLNHLSNAGTYNMNFGIGASTKLAKYLNWNLSLSDRYHPAPDRKTNDFPHTTGLGVTFAR